jgi:hypothetical protein
MFFFISFNILHCVHRTTRGILLFSLTLSYSSEGSEIINSKLSLLNIPGIPYNLLTVSDGDIGCLKINLGQVLAWKSGLKVTSLLLEPS